MSIRITSLRAGMSGFVTGVARLLDFGGALHVQRRHFQPGLPPGLADYLAIQSDWMATGQDIQQAHHRQEMERRQLELDRVGTLTSLHHERWGLVCGTVCVLALIAAALWIAWLGNTNAAAILGTGTLAGVATAFVVGTRARQRPVGTQPTSSRQASPEPHSERQNVSPPGRGTGQ